MDSSTAWPPNSARAALLSSPSGRRKYFQDQSEKENDGSPIRPSATRPNAAGNKGRVLRSADEGSGDEADEDEEILQLKLAAIEAKLKLKELRKGRARTTAPQAGQYRPPSVTTVYSNEGPKSSYSQPRSTISAAQPTSSQVEIPLSPSKRQIPQHEPRSPSRLLLGIDKGKTGADVSLRRARIRTRSPIKNGPDSSTNRARPSSRVSVYGSARSAGSAQCHAVDHVKSFSERMVAARDTDRSQQDRREAIHRARGAALKLDKAELESYRLAAEEAARHHPPSSPSRRRPDTAFSRDDVLHIDRKDDAESRVLRKSRTLPDLRQHPLRAAPATHTNNTELDSIKPLRQGDSSLYESYSHLNLSSRVLPHSFLSRTLPSDTFSSMRIPDLLKQVTSPDYELPDSVIDFAVFGIIASKSTPLDHKTGQGVLKSASENDWEQKWEDGSQNQRKFMVFTITDLKWSVDLYLFGTAVPRYHRLSPGTVVAILNPSIMPPKTGRADTGAFSLTLHSSDDTVLEIGTSRDLGFCNAVKKDGKECGSWINASKTEICEFHLNLQVSKTQSSRMGVNAGTNGFGGGAGTGLRNQNNPYVPGSKYKENGEGRGLLPKKDGHRYDKFTSSHFYISNSNVGGHTRGAGAPIYRPGGSTAQMLDLEDDDPFIAEGQLLRDKEARMRKRLDTQERERRIAKGLVAMGSGGAGAEYLRHRAGEKVTGGENGGETGSQRSGVLNKHSILGAGRNANGKRAAESVRLSPIKKTRFVTERGVKEAGRESLGGESVWKGRRDGDGEDDDLDIV